MGLTKVTYAMIEGASVNVLDYGATGDGTTDDTAAIQSAIDSGAQGIYFPQPSTNYKLASTVTISSNVTLYSDGNAKIVYSQSTGVAFDVTDCDNVTIKNLEIQSSGYTGGTYPTGLTSNNIIEVLGGSNIAIDNCKIHGAGRDCVYVGYGTTYPSNVKITNNILYNAQRNGCSIVSGDNVDFCNNEVSAFLLLGVDVEPNVGEPRVANVSITGNYVENTEEAGSACIQASTGSATPDATKYYNVRIADNTIIGSLTAFNASQISVNSFYDVIVANNICRNYTQAISSSASNVIIDGNVMSVPSTITGAGTYGAIYIAGAAICTNNKIDGAAYNGIYAQQATNSTIANNIVKNAGQQGGGVSTKSNGIYVYQTNNAIVSNNITVDDQGSPTMYRGVYTRYQASPLTGVDNIVIGNFSSGATDTNEYVDAPQFQKVYYANSGVQITQNTGIPGSGTYATGATIYNQTPTSGGYIGWVCTAGGTPGTWKGFGLIA